MKKYIPIILGLIFTCQMLASEVIIDIPSIAGKTKSQVSTAIGTPTSCSKSKYGEKCQYEKGETEIVFINGKADWITVEGLDHLPFSDSVLKQLGLDTSKPTFSNAFTKRWEPHQGLLSVSLFQGSENSDYAYIKAVTK